MISTRIYNCNDHTYHQIRVETTHDSQNKINSITIFKKSHDSDDWTRCVISGSPVINNDYILLDLQTDHYCQALRIHHNQAKTSAIRLRQKWLPIEYKPLLQNTAQSQQPPKETATSNQATKAAGISFKGKTLDANSPFHEIAQYLAETYYWQPYPLQTAASRIKRPRHGATHAACSTYTADNLNVNDHTSPPRQHVEGQSYNGGLFIEILKKYLPNDYFKIIRTLNDNQDLTEEDFKLIKCAIFCHDIANTSDAAFHDEEAHAAIFRKEMLALGFEPEKINQYAHAIANKDSPDDKNICQMLIHDADCLEINRELNSASDFSIEELDIVKLLRAHINDGTVLNNAIADIKIIGQHYFDLMRYIYDNDKVHEACELSRSIYLHASKLIPAFSLQQKVAQLESFKQDFPGRFKKPFKGEFADPLDIYDPQSTHGIAKELSRYLFGDPLPETTVDAVLASFEKNGLFIRVLSSLNNEFPVLGKNAATLKANGIKTAQQLNAYFTNNETSGLAPLLPGLLLRPSTFIKAGLAIMKCAELPGVLIDPTASSTLPIRFYKHNVFSDGINEYFLFKRPQRIKDAGKLPDFSNKLAEKERRRTGQAWDNYNRNFGIRHNYHNEVLLTYSPDDAVVGIAVTLDNVTASIEHKLKLQAKTGKSVPFYHYDARGQLHAVTDETVLSHLFDTSNSREYDTQLGRLLRDLQHENIVYPPAGNPYFTLDINHLEISHCSLEKFAPSPQHPVRYSFEDKTNKLTGHAYYKNGFPVIELNGQAFYDTTGFIARIAALHQNNMLQKCNALLTQKPAIDGSGVKRANLEIVLTTKNYLSLRYEPASTLQPQEVLEKMGYPYQQCKWEVINNGNTAEVQVRLSVVQALDAIHQQLVSYTLKPQNTGDKQPPSLRR